MTTNSMTRKDLDIGRQLRTPQRVGNCNGGGTVTPSPAPGGGGGGDGRVHTVVTPSGKSQRCITERKTSTVLSRLPTSTLRLLNLLYL